MPLFLQTKLEVDIAEALRPALAAIDAGAHKLGPNIETDFMACYTAAWVHTKMATKAVTLFEKQGALEKACRLTRKLLGE